MSKSNSEEEAILPLIAFTQTRMAKELLKIKTKSTKEFDRLAKADLIKLSKEGNLKGIKKTFSNLLQYLQKATSSSKAVTARQLQQQIPTIKESIKKLEEYHKLSSNDLRKVIETKEFKKFNEFFNTKFPKQIEIEKEMEQSLDEERIGIWDVETVKKDRDYELFFIRREDGSHFFSSDLVKKLRFSIDFSHLESDKAPHDPILSYKEIQDKELHMLAKNLFDKNYRKIQWYLQAEWEEQDRHLYLLLRKALMALLIACHSNSLLTNTPAKMCSYYFYDFQVFLRDVISNPKFKEYCDPNARSSPVQKIMVELAQDLCGSIYTRNLPSHEKYEVIGEMIKRSRIKQKKKPRKEGAIEQLIHDFQDFNSELEQHAGGPLIKVWDYLQDADQLKAFDSILQENIPSNLFDIKWDDWLLHCLRIPSPTKQLYIQKAEITEEFQSFLRAMLSKNKSYKHLIINLQNRTSIKGYSRSEALEQLQTAYEFSDLLTVVTLPRETDFYKQKGEYETLDQSKDFIASFKNQILSGVDCGFFFPKKTHSALSESFLNQMFKQVNQIFFSNKKQITYADRKAFIDLSYLLIEVKLIETIHPSSFSLTCKDSIDSGGASNALLYSFIELLNKKDLQEKSREFINRILFDIPMMTRERTINHEDFDRLTLCIQLIKKTVDSNKLLQLRKLFSKDLFNLKVLE